MDPATLATAATSFLIPYLTKIGENIAESAGKILWDTITDKFKDKPAAAGAASEFVENTDNPDNQEAFTLQLKKVLKDDPEFAQEIARLVSKLESSSGGISNTGSGTVATEGSIATGGIQTGDVSGNILIGNQNTVSQRTTQENKKEEHQE
jgi:hypothetical protein